MQHNRPFGIVDCAIFVGTVLVLVGTCWLAQLNDIHAEDAPFHDAIFKKMSQYHLYFRQHFIPREPEGPDRTADMERMMVAE